MLIFLIRNNKRSKYNWSNDIWSNNIWSNISTKCCFLSIRFNILSNDIWSNFKYSNKIFDQKLILQSQNQHLVEYLCLGEMNASEQVFQQTVEWKVVKCERAGVPPADAGARGLSQGQKLGQGQGQVYIIIKFIYQFDKLISIIISYYSSLSVVTTCQFLIISSIH